MSRKLDLPHGFKVGELVKIRSKNFKGPKLGMTVESRFRGDDAITVWICGEGARYEFVNPDREGDEIIRLIERKE